MSFRYQYLPDVYQNEVRTRSRMDVLSDRPGWRPPLRLPSHRGRQSRHASAAQEGSSPGTWCKSGLPHQPGFVMLAGLF